MPATATRNPPTRRTRSRLDRRTRSARAEQRDAREALLDAALDVCAENGYAMASVDAIAERAGYSKGALYWHFGSKDELFHALYEERIDRPWRESAALLESAAANEDMAEDASRRFGELMQAQPQMVVVGHEYWMHAVRDPAVRKRFAARHRSLRRAMGKALAARMERLGAPPLQMDPEAMATAVIAIGLGLSQQKLIDPTFVPADLYGQIMALIYSGHLARTSGAADGD